MTANHVKVAISIPGSEFTKIEKTRKRLSMTRSEFMLTTVRSWFAALEKENQSRQYIEGYQTMPEDLSAIKVMERVQAEVIEEENW